MGYLQDKIIEIGKEKGFVTTDDVRRFYAKDIDVVMNKLVLKGFFEKGQDGGVKVIWRFKE